jgi:glycosyltransferase involved in cell wall biosynthesis
MLHKLLWRTMLDVYNQLDAVTAPTQTAVSILQSQQLLPPAVATSNGVDQTRFHPRPMLNRMAVRRKYGLALDRAVLLYVGRIDPEKCLDVLVQAQAQRQRNDVQLVIAGKGSHRHELEHLCQRLHVDRDVRFTGFIPDADLPLLLNSADAFAMPGHAELQSIATLEAMSSGLPILAANARALPELVKPDVNGYLFAPHDVDDAARQITRLLDNRSRWAEMSQASLENVAPHTHLRTIERYANWYMETRPLAQPKARSTKPLLETYAASAQVLAAALVLHR